MDSQESPALSTAELWQLFLIQSAVLVAISLGILWWFGIPLGLDCPSPSEVLLAVGMVLPLLLSSFLLWKGSVHYGRAVDLLQRLLGPPLRYRHIPWLALLSASVEELLFRGALQPLLGLPLASVLFGLVHVWNRHLWVHGLWAGVAGVYLGLAYQMTGNLWVPLITHALNNLIGLFILKQNTAKG